MPGHCGAIIAHVDPGLARLRRGYGRAALRRSDLAPDWLTQFRSWFAEAAAAPEVVEPNAMVLATADAAGVPSARTVLLKGVDQAGFTFFTNLGSRKGRDLAANPHAALVFSWVPLERQVVAAGEVVAVDPAVTRDYARSRPRESQLAAWASRQSSPVGSREELEEAFAAVRERFAGVDPLPVPPFWGGFTLAPQTVEFWQGRPDRLHDRLRYRCDGPAAVVERLYP